MSTIQNIVDVADHNLEVTIATSKKEIAKAKAEYDRVCKRAEDRILEATLAAELCRKLTSQNNEY